ncbi:putative type IX secretion system sortase PorU2 [Hymenobacter latericus]|uniref:putative type IX secretion system sortase PorU2 n=1 Tax=Hymenobacter sp. YIM 151858-1 TaxID=2987688 RepID=UPI002226BE2A|nr:C25 family cysteine peptidase [Hymenobacter sp. YIM 151858-1]UYZ59629.1 C25 family cysteine peptidase [Hymenobacter sp. YIM 151858-1]
MNNLYAPRLWRWSMLLVMLVLGAAQSTLAQSRQYGNEWIDHNKTYYKIKIIKDGLYRLDQAYLSRLGLSGVEPRRLQLWRRGQEVAMYGGGNQTQLDATTYLEFYGQRNDGKLDRDMYKTAAEQPHQLYSLFTDTAAYFLTWSANSAGKRMAEPAATASGSHGNWLQPRLLLDNGDYHYGQTDAQVAFMPWADSGEGFLSGAIGRDNFTSFTYQLDGIGRRSAQGAMPWVEVLLVGASPSIHNTLVSAVAGGNGAERLLTATPVNYGPYAVRRVRYQLQRSDIGANGRVGIKVAVSNPAAPFADKFRVGYIRVVHPQTATWQAGQAALQVFNDSTLAGPASYQLDSIPASVIGYDVTDPANVQRIAGAAGAGNARVFTFPSAVGRTRQLLLADAAQPEVPMPAVRVRFRPISPGSHNFLIVSSGALMRSVGNVANPVREYANYRASNAGGRYDTLVVTSDLLYDQFHYGERSPLAVRRFAQYMLTAPVANRYLLLLGKGVMITEGWGGTFYRKASTAARATFPDLVPASTRGGSDIFFTADWQNDSYFPRIPTGRLAAQTPTDVLSYLNKLKEHEALGVEPWRKNVLHLGGGIRQNEFDQFHGYLRRYQSRAEAPLFGANVENIFRSNLGPYPVEVDLSPQLNKGVSLITYFGHASNSYLDLNPKDITVASNGYANKGKYPVFMAFGCAVGNNYTPYGSISESWVLVPEKGAIGFLADSDFGIDQELNDYADRLYQLMFNDPQWYGKPLTVIQTEVNKRLMAIPQYTNSRYAVSMLMNTTWQGDPAVSLYAPEKPDYAANSAQVLPLDPGPVLASSQRFKLQIAASNFGKFTSDEVKVTVERQVGSTITRTSKTFAGWRNNQVLDFELTNTGNVFGLNTFTVRLDDPNAIDELNENNNSVTTTFNFLQGGVTALNPHNFAIVGKQNVRLVAQSNLPQAQPRTFEFQLDTVATFNSPFVRSTTVQATDVVEWRPNLPAPTAPRDSVVYYWRVRFGANQGLDESWATNSFRYIGNSPGGWSQSHYGQMASNQKTGLTQDAPSGRWQFEERTRPVLLKTAGGGSGGNTFRPGYGVLTDNISTQTDNCGSIRSGTPNIIAAVYDGRTLQQLGNLGSGYLLCGQNGAPLYHFYADGSNNINTASGQAKLLQFLRDVPAGHYVALVSMNTVRFGSMDAALKDELEALGSRLIKQAQDGDPLVMMLRKGFPAQAQERTFDAGSTTPRQSQEISLGATVSARTGTGTVVSTRIGPAQQWQTLHHTIKKQEATDAYTLRLVGYDAQNNRTVLVPSVTNLAYSLAGVSAQQYPYLQLEAVLTDSVNRTAPQLKQWLVTYTPLPEGVVRRDHPTLPANVYAPAKLSADAASSGFLDIPVKFENVSAVDFPERLWAKATVRETAANGQSKEVELQSARVLKADSVATYVFRLDVRTFKGEGAVRIQVNSRQVPEQYYFNNELNLSFQSPNTSVPPVVDVAFDGVHILNGDIVSARPEILVDVKYEDKRRPIDDPSKVQVFLTRPNQAPQQVSMTDASLIRFVPDAASGRTRVYYTPGLLADGVYKLEVQARDMADNQAGAQRYAVNFEVINTSSITNIFPYPNPVTSRARFVFTLTGSELPRNMKIQILTISGKVVREIMQAELGPLHIGNNITEYAWDGTDQYGDKLANGTYLYRVVMDDPQNKFEHRTTNSKAEQAFKKGWGKLVLLR